MREYSGLGVEEIRRDVLSDKQPAILRGLVGHWQSVREFLDSPAALLRYLERHDSGAPVDALMTAPEVGGQIFYNAAMSGFNFYRNRLPLSQIAAQVLRYAQFAKPPAVAAQSALIRDCLPAFAQENPLPLFDAGILPRIWLGNRITTPTHVDEWNNVGCVVAGRRRFTLFPPEQIGNLYIGPLDFAPTGASMSMVSLRDPDFARYPKFRDALPAAQTAELGPGDAIFIPPLWWHHVESLEAFNVLVNYWWHDPQGDYAQADSAFDALLHGILSIRALPPQTRDAWRAFFEQYVFGATGGSIEHIPPERRGILDPLSPEQVSALRAHLVRKLHH
ncbi:MAG TPA: cupin-like domain-containing protein [Steroidobacteraceae bacterium]|nr:cupin-like domain-containing protein [Steroidobacteraceae bacterium]